MIAGRDAAAARSICVEGVGVQQFAQLRLAEKLAKLRLIDRERLGAAFRERRIAVVDVVGDIPEEQGGGKRGRARRVNRRGSDFAALDPVQRFNKRWYVEHVAKTFTVRFEQHREASHTGKPRQEDPRRAFVAARVGCARLDGASAKGALVPRLP